MSSVKRNRKILQIFPAGEWFAVYKNDDHRESETFEERLVCWALVEENGRHIAVGFVAVPDEEGNQITCAEDSDNFMRYIDQRDPAKSFPLT